jgi:hypothetical protein
LEELGVSAADYVGSLLGHNLIFLDPLRDIDTGVFFLVGLESVPQQFDS